MCVYIYFIYCTRLQSVSWLLKLLIDWLIDWLFDWLIDWLIDWLYSCIAELLSVTEVLHAPATRYGWNHNFKTLQKFSFFAFFHHGISGGLLVLTSNKMYLFFWICASVSYIDQKLPCSHLSTVNQSINHWFDGINTWQPHTCTTQCHVHHRLHEPRVIFKAADPACWFCPVQSAACCLRQTQASNIMADGRRKGAWTAACRGREQC